MEECCVWWRSWKTKLQVVPHHSNRFHTGCTAPEGAQVKPNPPLLKWGNGKKNVSSNRRPFFESQTDAMRKKLEQILHTSKRKQESIPVWCIPTATAVSSPGGRGLEYPLIPYLPDTLPPPTEGHGTRSTLPPERIWYQRYPTSMWTYRHL